MTAARPVFKCAGFVLGFQNGPLIRSRSFRYLSQMFSGMAFAGFAYWASCGNPMIPPASALFSGTLDCLDSFRVQRIILAYDLGSEASFERLSEPFTGLGMVCLKTGVRSYGLVASAMGMSASQLPVWGRALGAAPIFAVVKDAHLALAHHDWFQH